MINYEEESDHDQGEDEEEGEIEEQVEDKEYYQIGIENLPSSLTELDLGDNHFKDSDDAKFVLNQIKEAVGHLNVLKF